MTNSVQTPIFSGGILSDKSERTDSSRLNVSGVITIFWAWAYPCFRSWHTIIPILNLPSGKINVAISISEEKDEQLILLDKFTLETRAGTPSALTLARFNKHQFKSEGRHFIKISLEEYELDHSLPFEVATKEWPTFTNEEKKFAKSLNPNPLSIRVTIECRHCEKPYIFQVSMPDTMSRPQGVRKFPKSGKLNCSDKECKNTIFVKDIEGQLLSSLKENLLRIKNQ